MSDLFNTTKMCLDAKVFEQKTKLTKQLAIAWQTGELVLPSANISYDWMGDMTCGRPDKPILCPSSQLGSRNITTKEGHAAMLHAIAHIEFSAINLALDAICRFRDMPKTYYDDWVRIADEERYHFELIQARLSELGYMYGDFPAHNGLWRTAVETADDVLVRMALIPRVLEARGLDVSPMVIEKFKSIGDHKSVAILEIIERDEITHVAAGTRWFRYLCDERCLDADNAFKEIIKTRFFSTLRGPFNLKSRLAAGFSAKEITYLESL